MQNPPRSFILKIILCFLRKDIQEHTYFARSPK